MLGHLRHEDTAEVQYKKLMESWEIKKHTASNPIQASIFHAYRKEICVATFMNIIVASLTMMSPILINLIVNFVNDQEPRELKEGFLYVAILIIS